MKYTGAEIIIKLLEKRGICQLSGIPGGANLPIYDALSKSKKIRHILARHEQGAGFIAQGQARSNGEVAVFLATSGPGATNAITAVADAKLDSIPVVCITGQVPQSLIGTDAFQEIDSYGLSTPITKHNYFVRSAAELLEVIPEAFRIAEEGRPGPVWIDVPKDVQNEEIEVEAFPEFEGKAPSHTPSIPKIITMSKLINSAERPILYIGGGAIHSSAHEEICALAERLKAPVVSSLMGLGTIPVAHPQFAGMLGMHAARYTQKLLEECDLLMAFGVRFDDRATGKISEFCPQAKIVHIDIDPSEIGKLKQPTISMEADLRDALDTLLPHVLERSDETWLKRLEELKERFPLETPNAGSLFSPYGILLQSAKMLEGEFFVTTDVGQHQMRVAQCFPFEKPRQWMTSGGLGTMGFGLPAAIGAALEHPEATAVCYTGDGSLLMNIQELALIAEEGLNIKVIVSNNDSLGLVYQQQSLFYGKREMASRYQQRVDFCQIAEGFGIEAIDLGKVENPQSTLEQAMRSKEGVLINVPISVEDHVFPMVPPGGANHEMICGLKETAQKGALS